MLTWKGFKERVLDLVLQGGDWKRMLPAKGTREVNKVHLCSPHSKLRMQARDMFLSVVHNLVIIH